MHQTKVNNDPSEVITNKNIKVKPYFCCLGNFANLSFKKDLDPSLRHSGSRAVCASPLGLNTRYATKGGQKIDFHEDDKQNRLL